MLGTLAARSHGRRGNWFLMMSTDRRTSETCAPKQCGELASVKRVSSRVPTRAAGKTLYGPKHAELSQNPTQPPLPSSTTHRPHPHAHAAPPYPLPLAHPILPASPPPPTHHHTHPPTHTPTTTATTARGRRRWWSARAASRTTPHGDRRLHLQGSDRHLCHRSLGRRRQPRSVTWLPRLPRSSWRRWRGTTGRTRPRSNSSSNTGSRRMRMRRGSRPR